jgi:hypothetical protein
VLASGLAAPSAEAARRKVPVDTAPPRIEHTPPAACPLDAPCLIEAQITDDSGVFDPTLLFRAAGATTFERAPMQAVVGTPSLYRAVLPAALLVAGDVEYLVEAFDVQGNGPARAGSDDAPLRIVRPVPVVATPPDPPPDPPRTTTPAPAPTTTNTEDSMDTGLVVGLIAGGVAAAVLVGGGIAWALVAARPPVGPEVVTVSVTAPSPLPAALRAAEPQ